ncbi:unnamed protein product, partial [Closterium sp. NIES-64]
FYCDASPSKCQEREEAVAVTNISFINVTGRANGTHAILFNCSRSIPCTSLLLSNIAISPNVNRASRLAAAEFISAYGSTTGLLLPTPY